MQGQGLLIVIDALGIELENLKRQIAQLQQENAELRAEKQSQQVAK